MTKDDAKNFVTKEDLKQSLANYPTKDDLKEALEKQAEDFGQIVNDLFVSADKRKADREEVDLLEKRVSHIEQKLAA